MREKLARYAHEAWAGWMNYMFEKSPINEDGTATIPKWAVDRWRRQATTVYDDLPADEKESDREEADKILMLLQGKIMKDIDPKFSQVINEEFWNIL